MRYSALFLSAILFVALVGRLCPQAAHATTFVLMDEETLLHSSDAVLVGVVSAIEAGADADGVIRTYVHVQPERVIKGAVGLNEIVLREPGGRTGELEQRVYGVPEFWVGERSLLFLSRNPDGTVQTNALAMGKYSLAVNAAGQATAVRDFGAGTSVLVPATGEVIEAPRQVERFLPLLRRLRNLAHGERRAGRPVPPLTSVPQELSSVPTRFQDAYTFLGLPPARWFEPDTGQPVTYVVDFTGDTALGFATSRAAIDTGLAAWTNVSTSSLLLQDGGTTAPGPFNQCDINRIVFNDPSREISDPVNCAGILAIGGYCASYNTKVVNGATFTQIVAGKLTFNNGWGGCALWTPCNVQEVATHELGHTIGLGHSSDTSATMVAYAHFDGRCASLRSDDIAGVSFVYPVAGAKTLTATPTRSWTPTPAATSTPVRTPTAVPTATAIATATPTVLLVFSPTPTRTRTPSPSRTPTPVLSPTATRTWTASPAPTFTLTPTPSSVGLSGHISYYGSGLPVGGVTVQLQGLSSAALLTDAGGQFAVAGLPSAWWTAQPAKTGEAANAVDVVDAVTILEASVGLRVLTGPQQLACDTSGDGQVDVNDAVLILQHVVGLTGQFPAAQNCNSDWAFIPEPVMMPNAVQLQPRLSRNSCQAGALSFEPLAATATDQNFSAALFGDCTGDWQPGGAGAGGRLQTITDQVRLGRVRAVPRTHTLRVPLSVNVEHSFRTLQLELKYDPAAMRAASVRLVPGVTGALLQANLTEPGRVRLALASVAPIRGGAIATLEFEGRGDQRPSAGILRAAIGD